MGIVLEVYLEPETQLRYTYQELISHYLAICCHKHNQMAQSAAEGPIFIKMFALKISQTGTNNKNVYPQIHPNGANNNKNKVLYLL